MHSYISKRIISFLIKNYYYYLFRIHKLELNKDRFNILFHSRKVVLKPSFFIYIQYYIFYLFFYYLSHNHFWRMSFSLHSFHISRLSLRHFINKTKYKTTAFFKLSKYIYSIFIYLLCIHVIVSNKFLYQKVFFFLITTPFYFLTNVHSIYKKRLYSIQNNIETEPNLFIMTSNIDKIKYIYHYTKYFTMSSFIWLLNIIYYLCIS